MSFYSDFVLLEFSNHDQNELSASGTNLDATLLSEAQELIALHDDSIPTGSEGADADDEEPL